MSPRAFAAAALPCCSTEGNSWAEAAKAQTKLIFTSYTYNMPIHHLLEKRFPLNTDTDTCRPLYRVCELKVSVFPTTIKKVFIGKM